MNNAPHPALADPRRDPQQFLLDLYRTAVQRAQPLHSMAQHLPKPPKGRTVVLGAGKAGRAERSMKTLLLFALTAVAEIVGCYLPYLWLRKGGSAWLLLPGAASLALFAWLLTLHPTASGRVYAAYGGVYVATAIVWLWLVDGVRPTPWDLTGSAVALAGMLIIVWGWRQQG